jgi:hypothetical protein
MSYRNSWVIVTYCDYGVLNRKQTVCRHKTEQAAKRAWRFYRQWYGYRDPRYNYRVWQEQYPSGVIINDTGTYGHKEYV